MGGIAVLPLALACLPATLAVISWLSQHEWCSDLAQGQVHLCNKAMDRKLDQGTDVMTQ